MDLPGAAGAGAHAAGPGGTGSANHAYLLRADGPLADDAELSALYPGGANPERGRALGAADLVDALAPTQADHDDNTTGDDNSAGDGSVSGTEVAS